MLLPQLHATLQLHGTADGQQWLSFGHLSPVSALKLRWFLQVRQHFKREGRKIHATDQTLLPDYVRGSLRLHSGKDIWVGYYLVALDEEGSQYLKFFKNAYINK